MFQRFSQLFLAGMCALSIGFFYTKWLITAHLVWNGSSSEVSAFTIHLEIPDQPYRSGGLINNCFQK